MRAAAPRCAGKAGVCPPLLGKKGALAARRGPKPTQPYPLGVGRCPAGAPAAGAAFLAAAAAPVGPVPPTLTFAGGWPSRAPNPSPGPTRDPVELRRAEQRESARRRADHGRRVDQRRQSDCRSEWRRRAASRGQTHFSRALREVLCSGRLRPCASQA